MQHSRNIPPTYLPGPNTCHWPEQLEVHHLFVRAWYKHANLPHIWHFWDIFVAYLQTESKTNKEEKKKEWPQPQTHEIHCHTYLFIFATLPSKPTTTYHRLKIECFWPT